MENHKTRQREVGLGGYLDESLQAHIIPVINITLSLRSLFQHEGKSLSTLKVRNETRLLPAY